IHSTSEFSATSIAVPSGNTICTRPSSVRSRSPWTNGMFCSAATTSPSRSRVALPWTTAREAGGGEGFLLAFEGAVALDSGEVGGRRSGFLRACDARKDTPDAHTHQQSASHHV